MIGHSLVYNFRSWLDLAAPPTCLFCSSPTDGPGCCAGCRADLPWNRSACPGCALPSVLPQICPRCSRRPRRFDSAWSAFVLAAPVHSGLLGLKYHARFVQARVLGELMAAELRSRREPLPDLLLPVPLHWRRLIRRGYNQALLLARELGCQLELPVDTRTLRRPGAGRDQIGQSASARRANLRGVFSASGSLQGRHIALVDDVMTTGATFDELARVCRRAGAKRIEVWSVARTILS
ncbi:MAG: ComF family protein [Hydrocarboniphaga sp.]|uniref:ComF family protein n=1 Tax=Hydrocarboniphaga sp. TaxID=2033016 RepID=UPI002634CED1|nr:ComF family protein [Hydrocarboniphaga sp.]MDB5973223.1 ComF family protein [Hydrocarboniphaga sp.]